MSIVAELRIDALNNPSLEAWLRFFSADVWERIKFCRTNQRNHIFETTLTQNLVYEFLNLEHLGLLNLGIYESTQERINGTDVEFVFETESGFLTLACQCKILGRDMRYNNISHSVNGKFQIDLLIEYANVHQCVPIYLFYNYSNQEQINAEIQLRYQIPIYEFGCSFSDAHFLKRTWLNGADASRTNGWKIPSFADLHLGNPPILPFIEMARFFDSQYHIAFKKHFSQYFNFVASNEMMKPFDQTGWHSIIPPGQIGKIGRIDLTPHLELREQIANEEAFSPAYRIVFFR
jgi:hypothetical protein